MVGGNADFGGIVSSEPWGSALHPEYVVHLSDHSPCIFNIRNPRLSDLVAVI